MLKKTISYVDFNDNAVTETFYFNLSKSELVEMEVSEKEGLGEMLQRIVEEKDNRELVKQFKRIILAAYGQKSSDGKKFDKSEELSNEFSQTAAYDALFMELTTDETAVANFITGLMPKDFSVELAKLQQRASSPPPPPPTAA